MLNWQRVGSSFYRTRDVYEFPTSLGRSEVVDAKSIVRASSVVAVCPIVGLVAVINTLQGGSRLYLFTASFRILAEIELSLKAPIVGAFWSLLEKDDEGTPVLKVVTTDWKLRTVSLRPQHMFMPGFSIDLIPSATTHIIAAAVHKHHLALLSSEGLDIFLFDLMSGTPCKLAPVDQSLSNSQIVSIAVLPSEKGHVLVAFEDGALALVSESSCVLLKENAPDESILLMSVSYSGNLIATFSTNGRVETFLTSDILAQQVLKPIDSSLIDIGIAPSQLAWVGDDCLCVTFSTSARNVLFVGASNAWCPYEHESFIHVSSDLHCATVLTASKFQIIQRVAPATLNVNSGANSTEPEARLIQGFERFSANDVRAESIIRSIKNQLEHAVNACAEAAAFETPLCESLTDFQMEQIHQFLKASRFGRQFLPSPVRSSSVWVNAVALIRLCAALNAPEVGIPVGVSQLMSLGKAGMEKLARTLAARGEYLLALRVSKWIGLAPVVVQFIRDLWAFDLILTSDHLPDRELCAIISQRLRGHSLIKVAEFAFKFAGRKTLATTLLQFEADPHSQVKLLLALEAPDLAVQKALCSTQIDLIHTCLDASSASIHELVTTKSSSLTSSELALMLSLVQLRFLSDRKYEDLCKLLQTMPGCELLLADSSLCLVKDKFTSIPSATPNSTKSLEIAEWIQFSAERFAECVAAPASLLPNSPSGCQSTAALLGEYSQLIRAQVQLEKTAAAKGWAKGPHKFVGLSLNATLSKLLLLGELQEADSLRNKRRITDGRFWDLRLRTSLLNGKLEEGILFANQSVPPSTDCRGYKAVVEILLKLKREDLALPFIKKLKPKKQAEIYSQLGLVEEARNANQGSATGLFGRLASGFLGSR